MLIKSKLIVQQVPTPLLIVLISSELQQQPKPVLGLQLLLRRLGVILQLLLLPIR